MSDADGSAADIERQVLLLAVKRLFDLMLIKHWALSNENAYGLTMCRFDMVRFE